MIDDWFERFRTASDNTSHRMQYMSEVGIMPYRSPGSISRDPFGRERPPLVIDISRSVDDNVYGCKALMEIIKKIDSSWYDDGHKYRKDVVLKINPIQERILHAEHPNKFISGSKNVKTSIHLYGRKAEIIVDENWLRDGGPERRQEIHALGKSEE